MRLLRSASCSASCSGRSGTERRAWTGCGAAAALSLDGVGEGLVLSDGDGVSDADSDDADWKATAIVEDIGAALSGVIDPECSAIPYVVYRFQLPYMPWEFPIVAVRMSMTGFTVTVSASQHLLCG